MLHIHFGAGRLGLGLIAPAFRTHNSELVLLNRAVSGSNATGATSLGAARRNALLETCPSRRYLIERPGGSAADRRVVGYDEFLTYDDATVGATVASILDRSRGARAGVIVTAAILAIENYPAVIAALNLIAARKVDGADIGRIYLVACENTLNAPAVFADETLSAAISPAARAHVVPVHALVDRMCVGLEEVATEDGAAVLVRAEEFGSVKLELGPDSDDLVALCDGNG